MATQSAILWPAHFLPGTTDNFVSNERIIKDLTSSQIWALLANIDKWPSYYANCSNITPPTSGPFLHLHNTFSFSTFGFPPLPCKVEESTPPEANGAAGRLAWSAKTDDVEVYHAWLVEDLQGQRVRVLTQESQIGSVFKEWEGKKPNVMLLGHQDWLDGLVSKAKGEIGEEGVKGRETNLGSVGFGEGK
ncbi:hypothetical protein NX059_000575 [Plenodomus lindquistii]|nr:hypothetical protein NX059_000575 [Plenodomus lindquistii]